MRSRPIAVAVLAAALAACTGGGGGPTTSMPPTPAPTPAPQPVNSPEWKPGPRYGAWIIGDSGLPAPRESGSGLENPASAGQGAVVATDEPRDGTIYRGLNGWPAWFTLDLQLLRAAGDSIREFTHAGLDMVRTVVKRPDETGVTTWVGEMKYSSFGVAVDVMDEATTRALLPSAGWTEENLRLLDSRSPPYERGITLGANQRTAGGFEGYLTGNAPAVSAVWEGALVGIASHQGESFQGDARLDLEITGEGTTLSARFDNFLWPATGNQAWQADIPFCDGQWHDSCGEVPQFPGVHGASFANLKLREDGTFTTGDPAIELDAKSGEPQASQPVGNFMRIEGGFFGPDHVEAAGIVTKPSPFDYIGARYLWAFGAKKQP